MKNILVVTFAYIASVLAGGTFKTPMCVELDEPLTVTSEGTSKIILQGQITGSSFHMYLIDGWGDACSLAEKDVNIALVTVARVSSKHFATNYYANDTNACIKSCTTGWGVEIRNYETPFAIGSPFEMIIACETNFFQIFLNGKHLLSFPHQIKVERVTHMRLLGSATFRKIEIVRPVLDSNSASINICDPKYICS